VKDQFPKAFVRKCANDPSRIMESSETVKTKGKTAPAKRLKPKEEPSGPSTFGHTVTNIMPSAPSPTIPGKPVAPTVSTPPAPVPAPSPSTTSTAPAPSAMQSAQDLSEPQKIFEEAERQRGTGNYTQAIDLYKKVVQLSLSDGDLAGRAFYRTALCYDVIGEKKVSENGYAQAIEKWPGLDVAPAQILMDGGMKAYNSGKYDASLKIFSLYMTAYPENRKRAEYLIACTLMQLGRYNAAMLLFGRIIEQYPNSSEAMESIAAFGNIGMIVPKVRATMFIKGYEWYRDPIHAYDTALSMKPDSASAERLLYRKGCALMTLGRVEEAHRTLVNILKSYASSPLVDVYKAAIKLNIPKLFSVYYEREDYAGVVGSYFQATGYNVPMPADASTAIIIGRSLKRMGLNEDASNFLKAARIKASGKDIEEIAKVIEELGLSEAVAKSCDDTLKEYRELQTGGRAISASLAVRAADCLYQARQYGDSIPIYKWVLGFPLNIEEKRWVLLRTGQASLKTGNADGAKKAFDELKAVGADEFWAKLAEFAYEDGRWTENYRQNVKKK
ncbi:MAG: tetratricopeptide repeat protein, partial [Syntrophales bacterium]|nr:tetratricopeptide repeat protein [Syntrophales bacterium]